MKNIAAAMVKAQRAFGPALKTHTNPAFRSKYADLSACIEAVIDALNENGIALMQQSHECADGVLVETVFLHESGETMSAGKLHVPAAKKDPQGYGSALTYARRYSLMAACGIAPEDDDGNAASRKQTAAPVIPARPTNEELQIDPETERYLQELAEDVAALAKTDPQAADEKVRMQKLEGDQEIALANMLDSTTRAALRKARQAYMAKRKEDAGFSRA